MKNESALTRAVVKQLNGLPNCYAYRVHGGPHQRIGTLDINGCFRGAYFGIEMKMPGKEKNVTAIQAATINKIHQARGKAGVATNFDEALAVLGLKRSQDW